MSPDRPDSSEATNDREQVLDLLSTASTTSNTVAGIGILRRWGRHSTIHSWLLRTLLGFLGTLRRWLSGSVLYLGALTLSQRVENLLQRWIRSSYGYRWMTADPDPNVIVIDLRETKTVAPVLRSLDRVCAVLWPALVHARTRRIASRAARALRATPVRVLGIGLAGLGVAGLIDNAVTGSLTRVAVVLFGTMTLLGLLAVRDRRSWTELRRGPVVRVLSAVFVPPDPPARHRSRSDRDDKRDGSASDDGDEMPTDRDNNR